VPSLRSPHDREIARLALPALGALAAEPSYLLVDTAMVGRLAGDSLAALGLAASVLATLAGLAVVVAYATTAAVARLSGAGHDDDLRRVATQALWLGGGTGLLAAVLAVVLGPTWIAALGGEGDTADDAVRYLRIAAPGLGCAVLGLAAQGWLRGTGDLRTPLLVVLVGNAVNVVLNPLLIHVAGWGLTGSAIATLTGQTVMGAWFVALLWRAGRPTVPGERADRRPSGLLLRRLGRTGLLLLVRTGALLLTFAVAAGIAARSGEPALAAHQIGWQLFVFLALTLDAIAIAGQVLIGRALGGSRVDEARSAAGRMVVLTVVLGTLVGLVLLVARDPILSAFTPDGAVRAQAREMWPLLVLMLPFAAAVFAFDGILIGAGDAGFLAVAMVAAAVVGLPVMLALHDAGEGIAGVWTGIVVVMAARLAGTAWRFRGGRWARAGAWRG